MDTTAREIIATIDKKYPPSEDMQIQNVSDLDLEARLIYRYQYVIGVTRADSFGAVIEIEQYKTRIRAVFEKLPVQFDSLGWSFKGYEKDAAVEVLKELAAHYNADLDIDKMITRLNIRRDDDMNYFYIVVTVVMIPVITVE